MVVNLVCRDSVAQMLSNEHIMSMKVICVIMLVKENSFGFFLNFACKRFFLAHFLCALIYPKYIIKR